MHAPHRPRARRLRKGSRLTAVDLAGESLAVGSALLVDEAALGELPPSERDVAVHLLRGATNAEIGRLRGTSEPTIAKQVKSLYERLGVSSRVELASRLGRGSGALSR